MNKMTWIQKRSINSKLKKLDDVECINRGGCAIAAYALAEYIKERFAELEPKIVYLYDYEGSDYIRVKNGVADSCHHAKVKVGGYYMDSHGITEESHYRYEVEVDKDLVWKSLNLEGSWNYSFERYYGVPMIADILNVEKIKELV